MARTKEDVANKNRIGLNYKTRMEAARAETNAAVTSHQTAIEAKDKEISEAKTKLGEVNKELDGVKRKLAGVEKRLEESKKADEGKELTIKRLQGELTALKASGNAGDKPALVSVLIKLIIIIRADQGRNHCRRRRIHCRLVYLSWRKMLKRPKQLLPVAIRS